MTELLRELVAIPSVQGEAEDGFPFGREPARALEFMLGKCREAGLVTENVDNYAGSADHGNDPELAILCHLDVVPAGTGWETDPFRLEYDPATDKLTGRGAIDDKGPAVAALYAVKAIKECGIPLKKGVRLIFGTNEENGSADIAYYRTKRELPPMIFTPDGEYPVINAEKGMLRVYFSAPLTGGIFRNIAVDNAINAVPGAVRYTLTGEQNERCCTGTAAHASTPEKGENAVTKLLSEYRDADPLLAELARLFPHGETDGKSCGLGFSDEISGKMTCVLSVLSSSGDSISGGIDIRFPLDQTVFNISSIICGKLREAGFTIDSCEGVEPHITPESSPLVQSLLTAYERVTGDKGRCIAIGGGTYVHDIPGGVAFGAEFPGSDGLMHSPGEFITLNDLLRNAEIIAHAITEICR